MGVRLRENRYELNEGEGSNTNSMIGTRIWIVWRQDTCRTFACTNTGSYFGMLCTIYLHFKSLIAFMVHLFCKMTIGQETLLDYYHYLYIFR